MKKNILLMIVTAIIFTGIGAYATIQYRADEIGYGTGTIKDAIDDLYTTANTTVTGLESQITNLQNQVNNPDCITGTYPKAANSQINIDVGFTPTKFFLSHGISTDSKCYISYDSNIVNATYLFTVDSSQIFDKSTEYFISQNKIVSNIPSTKTRYSEAYTIYYMACK